LGLGSRAGGPDSGFLALLGMTIFEVFAPAGNALARASPLPEDDCFIASHPNVEEHDARVGHPFSWLGWICGFAVPGNTGSLDFARDDRV
jgi:hypothetical protein